MLIVPLFDIGKHMIDGQSKFFIKIKDKFLIEYCLQSIIIQDTDIIFILNDVDCNNFKLDIILKSIYKNSTIKIINTSNSVLDTLFRIKDDIKENKKIMIFAPPFTYFEPNFNINLYDADKDECLILLSKSNNPDHCYANIDDNKKIIDIKEKHIIGKYALIGLYCFKNKQTLFKYFHTLNLNNHLYLSDLLKNFINNDTISYEIIDLVYSFKNEQYIKYLKNKVIYKQDIKIGLSCDHSGFEQKNIMKKYLDNNLISYIDYGCYTSYDCDYHDFIKNQYNGYINNEFNFAISFCRSGQGVNICANHTGFISTLIYNTWSAQMAIEHNNCNCMCLSGKLLDDNEYDYQTIIDIIKNHKFLGGRFLDRMIKFTNN